MNLFQQSKTTQNMHNNINFKLNFYTFPPLLLRHSANPSIISLRDHSFAPLEVGGGMPRF